VKFWKILFCFCRHYPTFVFLGVFAKLRKATLSFVMSIRLPLGPSVRIEQLGSHSMEFNEIWYLIVYRTSIEKFKFYSNRTKITCTLHEDQYKFFKSNLVRFFLELETFQRKFLHKIKTHFVLSNVFRKSCRLWDNVEKYCRSGKATDDKMAHNILDT